MSPSLEDIASKLVILTARVDKAETRADNADARLVEADARTAKVEADNASLRERTTGVEANNAAVRSENADLKAEIEVLRAKVGKGPNAAADDGELMMRYSSRWRALLFVGGCTSTVFGVYGYAHNDERLSWFSVTLWAFSSVCLFGAAFGNPRNSRSWKEKLFIGICGLLFGVAALFEGLQLIAVVKNQATFNLGWTLVVGGITLMIVMPPAFIGANHLYSKLPDRHVSNTVKTTFKSIPQIAGSTLFVASASTRCLMKANLNDEPVAETCGNPTMPSFLVSVFLMFAWFLGYLIPPLLTGKTITWTDVMAIRMSKVEGTQFMLFGTLATFTLILFANTNEDGGDFNLFLQYLTAGFFITIISLFSLVIYESVAKPLLFPSNKTSNHELTTNPDSFNVNDTGALSIGSV
ncbi:hypothetical protein TrLO_g9761 [Triparma laevis f. longispina]|uniref:Uncharacterized protein n=1 Tax=Triparma laevis f. longispina TaxID=1714387 RepID=A0A9W7AS31_9STRA|nr:hypothetical protein TrLO_g9761 [Triparma laevis f. longispina]